MLIRLALIIILSALWSEGTACASSVVLNVSGNVYGTRYYYPNGVDTGTLSGTVTFDSTTGYATAANITATINGRPYFSFVDPAIPIAPPFPVIGPIQAPATDYSFVQNGLTTVDVVYHTAFGGGDELNFTVSDALLMSASGDPFAANSGSIHAYESTSGNYYITDGLLTLPNTVAPTPEPSCLVLLGTGVAGLAGIVRRRLLTA